MNKPRDSYPQAFVPEHLTRLLIDTIPYDVPFYIVIPNDNDDKKNSNDYRSETVQIFVDHDRRLRMNCLVDIDTEDSSPNLIPVGSVGIMRSHHIDPATQTVRDIYLADLRMADLHSLPGSDEVTRGAITPEDHNDYISLIDNSIVFDAFIAADINNMQTEDIPKSIFYGNETFYQQLEILDAQTEARIQSGLDEVELSNMQHDKNKKLRSRFETLSRRAAALGKRALRAGGPSNSLETAYPQGK